MGGGLSSNLLFASCTFVTLIGFKSLWGSEVLFSPLISLTTCGLDLCTKQVITNTYPSVPPIPGNLTVLFSFQPSQGLSESPEPPACATRPWPGVVAEKWLPSQEQHVQTCTSWWGCTEFWTANQEGRVPLGHQHPVALSKPFHISETHLLHRSQGKVRQAWGTVKNWAEKHKILDAGRVPAQLLRSCVTLAKWSNLPTPPCLRLQMGLMKESHEAM